jgi:hypothetical protein
MMEVDTDDDLLESSALNEARSRGPPPDILSPNLTSSKLTSNDKSHQSSKQTKPSSAANRNTTEYQPLLSDSGNLSDDQIDAEFVHLSCNNFESDPEFNDFVKQVEQAIDAGVLPQRIYEGSSGSYFAKNPQNVIKPQRITFKFSIYLKAVVFLENCRCF